MIASAKAKNLIMRFEGLSTTAYICPAGVATIGYGHTKSVQLTDQITEKTAERLLENDLRGVSTSLTVALDKNKISVTQSQFDALCSFAFNLGITKLLNSTLWQKLKAGYYKEAGAEFLKWNKARNEYGELVPLKGLTLRREAERNLFLEGFE